ncbi:MAG TPA: hypothetical protein PLB52_00950 [Candidatus Moranbacteria bacterium]|nr:hypothetical protein [Candidatus Moranbacteria bacterium]
MRIIIDIDGKGATVSEEVEFTSRTTIYEGKENIEAYEKDRDGKIVLKSRKAVIEKVEHLLKNTLLAK